jgi:hypothetical protein
VAGMVTHVGVVGLVGACGRPLLLAGGNARLGEHSYLGRRRMSEARVR